ncbi:MAG: GIY-YIG nuclease family protein [Candidatus Pacebacteria bacterium]|nr:GIY-YIG nuclease family protein [Candidatus Paceibacterota bacterium]
MSHFVYMVRCNDGSLYTGYTTNIEKRVSEHNGEGETKTARSAGARYTRPRRPVVLVYSESHYTRSAALKREAAIKKLSPTKKHALIGEQSKSDGKISNLL